MKTLVAVLVVVALLALVAGSGPLRQLRSVARGIAALGTLVFGGIALAALYGAIVLSGKGGGALLFLAIPAGIIAALFLYAFTSSRGTEKFEALPPAARLQKTHEGMAEEIARLEASIAAARQKLDGGLLTPGARKRLQHQIQRESDLLETFRLFQEKLEQTPTKPE